MRVLHVFGRERVSSKRKSEKAPAASSPVQALCPAPVRQLSGAASVVRESTAATWLALSMSPSGPRSASAGGGASVLQRVYVSTSVLHPPRFADVWTSTILLAGCQANQHVAAPLTPLRPWRAVAVPQPPLTIDWCAA